MSKQSFFPEDTKKYSAPKLKEGARIGVVGCGPAGTFFSYFMLNMAAMVDLNIQLDMYDPKDFSRSGPQGCNMCGGIISETLIQILASEGINLPSDVVQRGIDSYHMHMDIGSARIDTPGLEKKIGAVFRGLGPRGVTDTKWNGFDGHLQKLAMSLGANFIKQRVVDISMEEELYCLTTKNDEKRYYDLVVVTTGINSGFGHVLEKNNSGYKTPKSTKTLIREYHLGVEKVNQYLGSSMHVFLLPIKRLEFAAIIPKGDYVTLCMLGDDIDDELVQEFVDTPVVRSLFPPDMPLEKYACQCLPRINIQSIANCYADRLVCIGDSAFTRLYKDGIGAAYRASKAAATTVIFEGISRQDFKKYYWQASKSIHKDNKYGKMIFFITRMLGKKYIFRRAILLMVSREQRRGNANKPMSTVLWDMFSGSAPYKEIFMRTLSPQFWLGFIYYFVISFLPGNRNKNR